MRSPTRSEEDERRKVQETSRYERLVKKRIQLAEEKEGGRQQKRAGQRSWQSTEVRKAAVRTCGLGPG